MYADARENAARIIAKFRRNANSDSLHKAHTHVTLAVLHCEKITRLPHAQFTVFYGISSYFYAAKKRWTLIIGAQILRGNERIHRCHDAQE